MKPVRLIAFLIAATVVLGGCATTGTQEGADAAGGGAGAEAAGAEGATSAGAAGRGAMDGAAFEGSPLEDPESLLSERTIYFEFDSAEIPQKYQDVISAHAEYLAAHPDTDVVLEGHTDERGTREYNIGLGERRAQAVKKMMVLQGAAPDQLQVISFGEERPVAMDHDAEAWRLNRRVEILYSGVDDVQN